MSNRRLPMAIGLACVLITGCDEEASTPPPTPEVLLDAPHVMSAIEASGFDGVLFLEGDPPDIEGRYAFESREIRNILAIPTSGEGYSMSCLYDQQPDGLIKFVSGGSMGRPGPTVSGFVRGQDSRFTLFVQGRRPALASADSCWVQTVQLLGGQIGTDDEVKMYLLDVVTSTSQCPNDVWFDSREGSWALYEIDAHRNGDCSGPSDLM